jgi:hypothetical protein
MKSQHEFFRNASLFTMNGLIDPRMMPGYAPTAIGKGESKKNTNDISLLFRIRIAMHSFVGKLIFKSQS